MLQTEHIKKIREGVAGTESSLPYIFKALGDKTRFSIFLLLTRRGELCVTDIAHIFSISVPAASYQLKILEMSRLVRRERMGQMICYEIEKNNTMVQIITRLTNTYYGK